MPTAPRSAPKRETMNIRIKPEVRELIDRAARLQGKNRTEFVLGADQSRAGANKTATPRGGRFVN